MRPFRPIKPGEILQEELEANGWTQEDFANILNRPVQAVNEIIVGKKAITPEMAVDLSRALGTSPEYWLSLEAAYKLDLLRSNKVEETDIKRRSLLFSEAPVRELLKRKWIKVSDPTNLDELEQELCRFLNRKSIEDKTNLPFAARKVDSHSPHTRAQEAWVAQAKHLASKLKVTAFSKQALENIIGNLTKFSVEETNVAKIQQVLGDLGIRFVIVEHLLKTQIDGAAFWLDEQSPVVVLSLRYDRLDYFWFVLMHELAHIYSKDGMDNTILLDNELIGKDLQPILNAVEKKADRLASDWLIPQSKFEQFIKRTKPYYSRSAIFEFAKTIEVHPAIVIGQLQHRGEIPWTHFRNVLTKMRHLLTP